MKISGLDFHLIISWKLLVSLLNVQIPMFRHTLKDVVDDLHKIVLFV